MMYLIYAITGLAGGVLTGLAGLTAAMVVTPILCSVCGWSAYDAVTLSLIANVPSALVTCWTFYKNGNMELKRGLPVSAAAFLGAVVGSWLGWLFSQVSENGISYAVIISNLFLAVKFFLPVKEKKAQQPGQKRLILALVLAFLIGVECGFMGSAGGVLMLMVLTVVMGMDTKLAVGTSSMVMTLVALTVVMGMDTKLAVGTSSMVMTLVALTGAVSHVGMGARVGLIPGLIVTVACTLGAVVSARFANRVDEKTLNRAAGLVLILVSVASLLLC